MDIQVQQRQKQRKIMNRIKYVERISKKLEGQEAIAKLGQLSIDNEPIITEKHYQELHQEWRRDNAVNINKSRDVMQY